MNTIYLNIPAISICSAPKMLRIDQAPGRINMLRNGEKNCYSSELLPVTESAVWCLGTRL